GVRKWDATLLMLPACDLSSGFHIYALRFWPGAGELAPPTVRSLMEQGLPMQRFVVVCRMVVRARPALAAGPERLDAYAGLSQTRRAAGNIIFIRPALTAPGIGGPPHFRLGDCRTQRNLSEEGRADARRIGAAFRHYQVPVSGVWSSRWCR